MKSYRVILNGSWRSTYKTAIKTSRLSHACNRHLNTVRTIPGTFNTISVDTFRQHAFVPEKPVLITPRDGVSATEKFDQSGIGLPVLTKWFKHENAQCNHNNNEKSTIRQLDYDYLSKYKSVRLPYELAIDTNDISVLSAMDPQNRHIELLEALSKDLDQTCQSNGRSTESSEKIVFRRFDYPFSLFLDASTVSLGYRIPSLYIAQAQIIDLPKELQDDMPTPRLVKEAGKGDVYDANIWLGLPPTYTPLHKDPNPNLFVQVAGSKRVRVFRPEVGRSIFHQVQMKIGQNSSATFRGDEMMEGPQRKPLEDAVWQDDMSLDGFEAVVHPGDAVFIPKGWWHSFKSVGDHVSMSVNWVSDLVS